MLDKNDWGLQLGAHQSAPPIRIHMHYYISIRKCAHISHIDTRRHTVTEVNMCSCTFMDDVYAVSWHWHIALWKIIIFLMSLPYIKDFIHMYVRMNRVPYPSQDNIYPRKYYIKHIYTYIHVYSIT